MPTCGRSTATGSSTPDNESRGAFPGGVARPGMLPVAAIAACGTVGAAGTHSSG